ncbi:MAG: adenylate kinase [Culicoidibacterales bacterium]
MRIVLMGPPGVGKGTQAVLIAETLNIPHISTGDIFRKAMKDETELGLQVKQVVESGNLVSDELTAAIVKDRLAQTDCQNGFLLDGYPRNVEQAKTLDQIVSELGIKLDLVLDFTVDEIQLLERLSGRLVCRKCGSTYHQKYSAPKVEGVCDACGGEVYQREDDKPENVKTRLEVYFNQTKPVTDYYNQKGLLIQIDASGDKQTVFQNVQGALNQ